MPSPGRARYRDALAQRDFRWLTASFVSDQLGSWAYNVVLIGYVFDKTHSTSWLAAAGAARFVPGLLLSPYAGVLADRVARIRLIVLGALAASVAMAGATVVVAADGPVPLVLLFSFLTAAVSTVNRPAVGALLPDLVPEKDLAAANALTAGLENLMVLLGPALGGLLLVAGTKTTGMAVNALSFLAAAAFVSRIGTRSTGSGGDEPESVRAVLTAGVRVLRAQPVALALVLFCCLDTAVYGVSTVLYVPLSQRLGTGTEGYSYLLIASALGGVLVAGVVNRMSAAARAAPLVLGGMLLLALPYAALALTRAPAVGFVLMVLSGAGMVVVDVLAITALQRDLPKDSLGRVFGIFESLVPASVLLGSLVAAPLLQGLGLSRTLLVIGLGVPLLSVLSMRPVLRADRQSAARAEELRPRVDLLEQLDLLAATGRPALERLAAQVDVVELPARAVVLREGEPADALWVLVSGALSVKRARRLLREMTPGSYVGEIGLLRGRTRTATVRTTAPSLLWRIPGPDFLAAVESSGASASLQRGVALRLARSHPQEEAG